MTAVHNERERKERGQLAKTWCRQYGIPAPPDEFLYRLWVALADSESRLNGGAPEQRAESLKEMIAPYRGQRLRIISPGNGPAEGIFTAFIPLSSATRYYRQHRQTQKTIDLPSGDVFLSIPGKEGLLKVHTSNISPPF